MKFVSKTASPTNIPVRKAKQDKIKELLFEAVLLQIEEDDSARDELLALLQKPEQAVAAS